MFLTTLQQKSFVFYFIFRFNSDFQQGLFVFFLVLKQNYPIPLPKPMFLIIDFAHYLTKIRFFQTKTPICWVPIEK